MRAASREVGARAEGAARAGQHHRAHGVVLVAAAVGGRERLAHRARERVQLVGAVERQRGDAVVEREAQGTLHRARCSETARACGTKQASVPNLAALHEAIAAALPERECLVFGERRLSWAAVTERSRRLAAVLAAAGLGCRRARAGLANHESGQDHVALYLYNGNEYLEGMLGAMKARAAPFNVNYRYVEEELLYLFDNADAKAVIFHAGFAPTLAQHPRPAARSSGSSSRSRTARARRLAGALDYEAALAAAEPRAPAGLSPDDLYILYTGGTTGHAEGRALAAGRHLARDAAAAAHGAHAPGDRRARAARRGQGARACRCRPSCTAPRTGRPSRCGTPAAR